MQIYLFSLANHLTYPEKKGVGECISPFSFINRFLTKNSNRGCGKEIFFLI